MTRQRLDEYLDGALTQPQAAEVAAELATDAAAVKLLEQIKRERAFRGAALGSYAPSSEEAESAAVRIFAALQDEAQAPLSHIGPWRWVRRAGAIAAVLALVAGAFAFGRATAPVSTEQLAAKTVLVEKPAAAYAVLYTNELGETKTETFDTELDARAFLADRTAQANTQNGQAVASIDRPGAW